MNRRHAFFLMAVLLLAHTTAQADLVDVTAPGDSVQGVPNDGDWPGGEAPPLAIDDNSTTKYLHFKGDFDPDPGTGGAGFRVTPSGGQSVVIGLTFTTANDAEDRDPTEFELSGSNVSIDGPYIPIASGEIVDFAQATAWPRFTTNTTPIRFSNSMGYSHYQILFTAIRNASGANSMQIAEVEFLGSPAGGLPPEVDAGDDQIIGWKGAGNTILQLYPTIYDDDPCGIGETDPDYLTILWSCVTGPSVDFMGTETEPNAMVLFPEPGAYELLLQVWDDRDQQGSDLISIMIVEPECPLSDFSGDCKVSFSDVKILAEQWLDPPGCVGYPEGCADLAGNDGVDLVDLALSAQNWREDWTGFLRVNIAPQEAVLAGAQWRLDGGAWRTSGELVSDLMPGLHTVEYSIVENWIRPASTTFQIERGLITTIAGTHTQLPDSSLLINEFMAVNESTYPTTVEGKEVFSDWIEIYNAGPHSIELDGWRLTDEDDELTKWPLPNVSLGSDSFLVVYASGVEGVDHPGNYPYQDESGRYHTNFQLDGDGEYLALVDPNGEVAHEFREYTYDTGKYGYLPQQKDISYGLFANEQQYFTNSTPGSANSQGFSGISDRPEFSHRSNTFTQPFSLALTAPATGAQIRYTLDGSEPTEASGLYVGSIPISSTVEVQARVYEAGKAPSPVTGHTYIALAADVQSFSSDLPIVVLDTHGRGISTGGYTRVSAVFIDTDLDGRADITDSRDFAGRGGMKVRGRSTAGQPKHSYNFEVWDEDDQDEDVSIFGLPAESDWILYAPYNYDRVLINNAFMYELSNQIGRYAVHTRFVEVYLNTSGGSNISADDYVGLYIFMEKIKRGPDRVDVEGLDPWDSTEPRITGGYMLKIDRPDSGDSGFRTSIGNPTYGDGTLCYVDPKEVEITAAQSLYIRGYLDDFEAALYGPNSTDPNSGYAHYIDVASWVDHNLLNMLAKNVDALRLSTHLHKTRNGKIEMGPIWDFDRSLESADGRDDNPETWSGGTDYLNYIWWDGLFDDIDFWQKYIDRWTELRRSQFSTAQIDALIDSMAAEIAEAQIRNFNRWPSVGPRFGSFQGDIDHLKDWLTTRSAWVDAQFVRPPVFSPEQGYIEPGSTVSISNPNGTGKIYYTLDGSDPRVFGASEPVELFPLVDESASKRVLVPSGPVDEAWKGGAEPFDDNLWNTSTFISDKAGGVGYDENPDFKQYISYDVEDWMNGDLNPSANTTCYIRVAFDLTAEQLADVDGLILKMRYDDGYIAYLNGDKVAYSDNAPLVPVWDSKAGSGMEVISIPEQTDISIHTDKLHTGTNILAIHGLNVGTSSSDFLISAALGAFTNPGDRGGGQAAGDVSYSAIEYDGSPIALDETTRIKARVLGDGSTYSPWSGLTEATFAVDQLTEDLRITEIMYHPADDPDPCSPLNDDDFEFVELKNIGQDPIDLHWVSFTDGIYYTFPKLLLDADDYIVIVKDQAAFAARYDTNGINIAPGVYSLNLSNAGERIQLEDAIGLTIHDFTYKDSWFKITDGNGFSLTVRDPNNADPNEWDNKSNWRTSASSGGSPGWDDSGVIPERGTIVINELLAHSHDEASDWIELHNTSNEIVDIGGWFLSDSDGNFTKYEIAEGTYLDPCDYIVLRQDPNFGVVTDPGTREPFALSENGETVYLHAGRDGELMGLMDDEEFDASETGVSFGRYLKSTGTYNFVPMDYNTPGWENAYPKIGPVVITELMYHPTDPCAGDPTEYEDDDYEYIEIYNITGLSVMLEEYDNESGGYIPWQIEGVGFTFPANTTIPAYGYLVIARNTAAFAHRYGSLPAGMLLGPCGKMGNGGERIQLSKPGDENLDTPETDDYHLIRVDRVKYSDGSHPDGDEPDMWPTEPDGQGYSLTKTWPELYGNDPNNWTAEPPSPGGG